jgi:hypothetical protein
MIIFVSFSIANAAGYHIHKSSSEPSRFLTWVSISPKKILALQAARQQRRLTGGHQICFYMKRRYSFLAVRSQLFDMIATVSAGTKKVETAFRLTHSLSATASYRVLVFCSSVNRTRFMSVCCK